MQKGLRSQIPEIPRISWPRTTPWIDFSSKCSSSAATLISFPLPDSASERELDDSENHWTFISRIPTCFNSPLVTRTGRSATIRVATAASPVAVSTARSEPRGLTARPQGVSRAFRSLNSKHLEICNWPFLEPALRSS